MLLVLFLITGLGIVVSAAFMIGNLAERSRQTTVRASATENAAADLIAVMTDRLAVTAGLRLGNLTAADVEALNADLSSLPLPAGMHLDTASTGYRITAVRDTMRIPHDEKPLAVWPHHPRVGFDGVPPLGGLLASRTLEVDLYAAVRDSLGVRSGASQGIAVSQIPPYQEALYTSGTAEICAEYARGSLIGGTLRADGAIQMARCKFGMSYVGSIEAASDISVASSSGHWIFSPDYSTSDGSMQLSTVTRSATEADPDDVLRRWRGRVRIAPAMGAGVAQTRLQTEEVAGAGECMDFASCAGASHFSPSITLQRTVSGPSAAYQIGCGVAWGGVPCGAEIASAVTYKPWPFNSAPPAGQAALTPGSTTDIWEGFFPDPRRETRCTAQISTPAGIRTWQTFRCPTNAYGFRLDLGMLPEIPGGVLSVRRAINQVPGANPSGAQEVLYVTNGRALQGPLTIVSEVPVWIEGNLNVIPSGAQPPLLIQGPRIGLLPPDAEEQLTSSAVWDLAAPVGSSIAQSLPLQASDNVNLFGVFRTGYCRTIGSNYYGGSWEGMPALVGDWSDVSLRITGALIGVDETDRGAAHCGAWAAPMNSPLPGGDPLYVQQPLARQVVFDPRLLDTHERSGQRFQPPGSYLAANTPAGGFANTDRTPARQEGAFGGYTTLRLLRPLTSGAIPVMPSSAPVPAPPPLPPVNPPLPMNPMAAFNWTSTQLTANFDASISWDGAAAPLSYLWSFGDGATGTGVMPMHVFANGDDYRVALTITNGVGRQDTHERIVSLNRPPNARFTWGPQPARIRENVTFDAGTTTDPDASASAFQPLIYTWNFGDGTPAVSSVHPAVSTQHQYTSFGSFTARLTVDDQRGGTATTTRTVNIENRPPVACFTPDSVEVFRGHQITLDATCSSDPDVGHTSELTYTWDLGDGGGSVSGARITHSYPKQGVYTATVTARDAFGGADTFSGRIYVTNRAPVLIWRIDPDTVTNDVQVTFDAGGTTDPDNDPITYTWDFGDDSPVRTGQVVTHTYEWPAPHYWVKLRADDGLGGAAIDSAKVVVSNRKPLARFSTTPDTVYTGTEVTFDASTSHDPDGGKLSYYWRFGDDSPPTGYSANPVAKHTYDKVGTYRVTIWVADEHWNNGITNGDRDSAIQNIVVVNRPPAARFSWDPEIIYRGTAVRFDGRASSDPDLNQTITYEWDFGDGTTGVGSRPSKTYSSIGPKIVSLTVSDGAGGSHTISHMVHVSNRAPAARITAAPNPTYVATSVLFGAAESADPDGDPMTFRWTFGDGASADGPEVSHRYGAKGSYTARLIATDTYGMADTASVVIRVLNTAPVACFTPVSDSVPMNQTVNFSAACSTDVDGDRLTYTWDFGDSSSSSGRNVSHAYRTRGTYPVTLTVSDPDGASSTATGMITVVNRDPTAYFSAYPLTVVRGQSVTFSGIGSWDPDGDPLQYSISFGDGSSASWQSSYSFNHTYREVGTFTATLHVRDGHGGSAAREAQISVVNRDPRACFAPLSATVVRGQVVGFDPSCSSDADGDPLTYLWEFGDGTTSADRLPGKSYSEVGAFQVKLTVSDVHGGSHYQVGSVTVNNRAPNADFNWSPSTVYALTEVTFNAALSSDADGDPLSYSWDFGDGTSATGVRPTKSYAGPGSYQVTLTVADSFGSMHSVRKTVVVSNRRPTASFSFSPNDPEVDEAIQFTSTSTDPDGDSLTCMWNFGDGWSSSLCSSPKAYFTPGNKTVTLTVWDEWGTSHSVTKTVLVTNPAAPAVSFVSGASSGSPDSTYTMTFRVKNVAASTRILELDAAATNSEPVQVTGLSDYVLMLEPGQSRNVTVSLLVRGIARATAGATTNIEFSAKDSQAQSVLSKVARGFTINTVRFSPTVVHPNPYDVYVAPNQWVNTPLTVRNNSNRPETLDYSVASSDSAVIGYSSASGDCTNVAPGSSCVVTYRWYAGSGFADGSLTAWLSGRTDFYDTGRFRGHVGHPPTITQTDGTTTTTYGRGEESVRFYVHNPNVNYRTYDFAAMSSDSSVVINRVTPTSQSLGAGAGTYVTVYYQPVKPGKAAIYVTATDRGSPGLTGFGWADITVQPTYTLKVDPSSITIWSSPYWYDFNFEITNNSEVCRYARIWVEGFDSYLLANHDFDRPTTRIYLCPGQKAVGRLASRARPERHGTVTYTFHVEDDIESNGGIMTRTSVMRQIHVTTGMAPQ